MRRKLQAIDVLRERGKATVLLSAFAVFCAAGCGRDTIRPIDIFPEDMCAHCRMAISEKRCAAELIDKDGTAVKFDDIGCMVEYTKAHGRESVAAFFLEDYEGGGWISAAEAFLVGAARINTPMGGSTVAFKDRAKASVAAEKFGGEVKSFSAVVP